MKHLFLNFFLQPQGPRNGFQLTGAQSAISARGGCLNQAPSPWPQIGPKLTGAWHPLLKIDGCTGTRGTRSYEDPEIYHENINKPLDGVYLVDFGIDIIGYMLQWVIMITSGLSDQNCIISRWDLLNAQLLA